MGLDVGVVKINYLVAPESPVNEFLLHLASDASLGCEDEEYEEATNDGESYTWGGGWEGNVLVEFSRSYLNWKADRWVNSARIGSEEQTAVRRWIDGLPWENDMVMLHLGG